MYEEIREKLAECCRIMREEGKIRRFTPQSDAEELLNLETKDCRIRVCRKKPELPQLLKERMKLSELKEVVDAAITRAEDTDPCVEFWVGEDEYELDNIGQFSIVPDLTIELIDFKAGFEQVVKEE